MHLQFYSDCLVACEAVRQGGQYPVAEVALALGALGYEPVAVRRVGGWVVQEPLFQPLLAWVGGRAAWEADLWDSPPVPGGHGGPLAALAHQMAA